jgi:hypothetical protein
MPRFRGYDIRLARGWLYYLHGCISHQLGLLGGSASLHGWALFGELPVSVDVGELLLVKVIAVDERISVQKERTVGDSCTRKLVYFARTVISFVVRSNVAHVFGA